MKTTGVFSHQAGASSKTANFSARLSSKVRVAGKII
jgi:hypothetical protein